MEQTTIAGKIVLFVDDEENILSALKRELRAWSREKGVELLSANSAKAALAMIEERPNNIAIVVSDLRMPVMKGSDFLVIVREKWPSIVTLLLTGFSEIEEVLKAVKAGIFSYLLKPWDSEYLIAELDKALEVYRVTRDNEEFLAMLQEELKWAGEMQKAFLKPAPLKLEGIELRSSWRPVPGLYCGGDYYDVIAVGSGRFLVLIGEVASRGVRGALVTAILKAIIYPEYVRSIAGNRISPGALLTWLNARIQFEVKKAEELTIAFLAAVIDRNELTLTCANAGLPIPFLIRNGIPNEMSRSEPPLGSFPTAAYTENSVKIQIGDIFIAYTDGLFNHGTGTPTALMHTALRTTEYGADFHKRVMESALAGSGAPAFIDDVTMVTARVE